MSLSEKLFDAVRANDARELTRVLNEGADPNAQGVSDLTPLHVSGVADAHFAAAELLRKGARPEALDQRERAPLHAAALAMGYKVMRLLLDARVSVDPRDQEGKTPLANLAWNGGEEGVKMLLDAGADPNAVDALGHNPLLLAMKAGHRNVALMAMLVRAGANPNLRDNEGQSARSLAEFTQNHEALGLFYGAMSIDAKKAPQKSAAPRPSARPAPEKELLEPLTTVGLQQQLERKRLRQGESTSSAPLNVKRRVIPF